MSKKRNKRGRETLIFFFKLCEFFFFMGYFLFLQKKGRGGGFYFLKVQEIKIYSSEQEIEELKEQVRDMMFFLEAQDKIKVGTCSTIEHFWKIIIINQNSNIMKRDVRRSGN